MEGDLQERLLERQEAFSSLLAEFHWERQIRKIGYWTWPIQLKAGCKAELSPCHQNSPLRSPTLARILVLHKPMAHWATFC